MYFLIIIDIVTLKITEYSIFEYFVDTDFTKKLTEQVYNIGGELSECYNIMFC